MTTNNLYDTLIQQVQSIIAETLQHDKKRREAKTETKRRYYKKKQDKNNKILAELLPVVEKAKQRSEMTTAHQNPTSPTSTEFPLTLNYLSLPEEHE